MSQQLLNTIRHVQKQIVNCPKAFENEKQTLNSLIDPVLNALGWDTRDHNHVRYEFKTARHNRVDIALVHNSYPEVFLEAKSLKHKLDESYEDDLRNYCNDKNVKTGILTNGAEWRAYHFYQPKQSGSDYKSIMLFQVQLGEDEEAATSATSQLSMLARDSINELDTKKHSTLLDRYWYKKGKEELLNYLLRNYSKRFLVSFQEWSGLQLPRKVVQEKIRNLIHDKLCYTQQHPTQQISSTITQTKRSESGLSSISPIHPFEVKNNTEALIKVVEWLVENRYLTRDDCPFKRGERSKYILIHYEEQHPDWSPYKQLKPLSNGFYLDTQGDAAAMIKQAKSLMVRFATSLKFEDLIRFSS